MVGDTTSFLSIENAGGADKYLSPPARGDVLVMSEKHLVDSTTGAAGKFQDRWRIDCSSEIF